MGPRAEPRARGQEFVIPVAILTTETFDAIQVDPLTVAFGPSGASESHGRSHIKDVDDDGNSDLILHFNTQEADIACGDNEATLTGERLLAVIRSLSLAPTRSEW